MELTGKQTISVSQDRVWAALNDPAILRQCIPGCDSFDASGENQYDAVMAVSVGPIKARFKGKLQLSDIQAPNSYSLSFDGSGGAAGFGKGTAKVTLATVEGGTELEYAVEAKVGGRLAQVGARLIDGVAKKMADEFFSRFKTAVEPAAVEGATDGPAAGADTANATQAPTPSTPSSWRPWAWTAAAIIVIAAIVWFTR